MTLETGTLVVHRPWATWRDALRAYRIEVDGALRGKIRPGKSLSVALQPGTHRVRARIDWTGSPELDITVVAGMSVECRVEPAGSAFAMWQIFGQQGYLRLSLVD